MPNSTTVAIGANFDDGNAGINTGTVKVFSWDGTKWSQKGTEVQGEAFGDQSGYSVSMPDEKTFATGAIANSGNGASAGQARVFVWDGSKWIQKGGDIDGENAGDQSGYKVSMPDANTVAISALSNDGGGKDAGQVRIFKWNGNKWVQKGADLDGMAAGNLFGFSINMADSNTIAVGAVHTAGGGTRRGEVQVYTWNGTAWKQKGTNLNGGTDNDQLGWSVSMPNASVLAVSSVFNDGNGTNSGQVKVYNWSGSAWVQRGSDIYGAKGAIALGQDIVMPDANTLAASSTHLMGFVNVYRWNGTKWMQKAMTIDGGKVNEGFGQSISMGDNNTLAIGSPENDDASTNAGSTKMFRICEPISSSITVEACESYTTPSGKKITATGRYSDTLVSKNGCDSILSIFVAISVLKDQTVNTKTTEFGCDSADVTINLASSQKGAWYYLVDNSNGEIIDEPVVGTGSAVSFSKDRIKATRTYAVEASTISGGLTFDGVDDYVEVANQLTDDDEDQTIETWIKIESYPTNGDRIIQRGLDGVGGAWSIAIDAAANGKIVLATSTNGDDILTSTNAISVGEWHHIAATFTAGSSPDLRLYVDGKAEGSLTPKAGKLRTSSASFLFGRGNLSTEWFKGKIDEVRIWNKALSATQIKDHFDNCIAGDEDFLVGHYKLELGSGSSAKDYSQSQANATLKNGPAWGAGYMACECKLILSEKPTVRVSSIQDQTVSSSVDQLCGTAEVTVSLGSSQNEIAYYLINSATSKIAEGPLVGNGSQVSFNKTTISEETSFEVVAEQLSYGLEFDGIDDYVEVANQLTKDNESQTIEAWVKIDAYPANADRIIQRGLDGVGGAWSISIDVATDGKIVLATSTNGDDFITSKNAIGLGEWHHIAATFTAGTSPDLRLYIDGNAEGSLTPKGGTLRTSGASFLFGRGNLSTEWFKGSIDEVRIWNTARTAQQIADNSGTCLAGNEASLVAYYKFEDATGTTATDLTANQNNATLKDMTNGSWVVAYGGCECAKTFATTITESVDTLDLTVSVNESTLTANLGGAKYQWLDCDNGYAEINGADQQSYDATANGNYAVAITVDNCTDTSECQNVIIIGVNHPLSQSVSLFPNPNNGEFLLNVDKSLVGSDLSVYDATGRKVAQLRVNTASENHNLSLIKGVYIAKIAQNNEAPVSIRFVVK